MDEGAQNALRYFEPAIIMSFGALVPDLIAKFTSETSQTCVVVFPEEHEGVNITLFDEFRRPLPFSIDTGMKSIWPRLDEAHPFREPKLMNSEYHYEGWAPMITEKMGTWL